MPPKQKPPTLEQLISERNQLMITKTDPIRLAKVKSEIDYLEWGITTDKK